MEIFKIGDLIQKSHTTLEIVKGGKSLCQGCYYEQAGGVNCPKDTPDCIEGGYQYEEVKLIEGEA